MNHGATGAVADVTRPIRERRGMGLKKLDALLLSDPNLVAGAFDLLLHKELRATQRIKWAILARVVLQYAAVGILIYCRLVKEGEHSLAETVAFGLLGGALLLFLATRLKFKKLAADAHRKGLPVMQGPRWFAMVYVAAYIMPVAAFFNIGVALTLDPMKRPLKVAVWFVQLVIKAVCTLILLVYAVYYKVYAEAWHCYKHETKVSQYKYGYCPSYTHQDSNYLDPSNVMCRVNAPEAARSCFGDRTADQIPRNWLSHGRWTYAVLLVALHLSMLKL
jgi:hypothetical protein